MRLYGKPINLISDELYRKWLVAPQQIIFLPGFCSLIQTKFSAIWRSRKFVPSFMSEIRYLVFFNTCVQNIAAESFAIIWFDNVLIKAVSDEIIRFGCIFSKRLNM